jgi:L-aminopeptidase/D-esterase-like protein
LVPAAILYDLSNGGEKAWGSHPPYGDLGRRALEEAEAGKPMHLGAAGAGYGARAGAHSGGLGAASWQLEGGGHLAALVALNSFGSPFMPGTQIPWAAPFAVGDEMGDVAGAPFARALGWPDDTKTGGAEARANTSLVAVATDIALTRADLQRVAWMAAAGLARAVRPVFAPYDGDVVFALSTAVHAPPEGGALSIARLGNLAADAVARAAGRAAVLGSSRGV